MVARLDFLLAATNWRKLVIEKQAPELGGSLCGRTDRGDEVILECGVIGAVIGEAQQLRGRVKSVRACIAGRGVRVVVGAVAAVCAAGGGGDVARAGVDGCFVYGVSGAFDAEVDAARVSEREEGGDEVEGRYML